MPLSERKLRQLYLREKRSSAEIAKVFRCSEHKVNYWLQKYGISKRSISDAIYIKHNPRGDPFRIKEPTNFYEAELRGLGLGLYWGEGTKRNKTSLKLANTDSGLVKKYIEFLQTIYGIDKKKIRFSLQVFSDADPQKALDFWCKELRISASQFSKTTVTPSRGVGTYKYRNQNGVLMVGFHNRKLRDIICNILESL